MLTLITLDLLFTFLLERGITVNFFSPKKSTIFENDYKTKCNLLFFNGVHILQDTQHFSMEINNY